MARGVEDPHTDFVSEHGVTPRPKRWARLAVAGLVILLGVAALIAIVDKRRAHVDYFTQPAGRGDIRNVITATGTVQPVVTVDVGSQVSGRIESLYADYNSKVKQGQVLAGIDPRTFQAAVANAAADLTAAQAHVRTMQAAVTNQQAALKAAQANLDDARAAREVASVTEQRNAELLKRALLARSDYDTSKAAADEAVAKYKQSVAALEQAQAQTTSSDADLAQARAQVEQAKAVLETARLNLSYCTISSPVDGVVVSRSVDVGQTVAASLQAPLLFVIANDLTKMQVSASVDEADVGQLSENATVTFFVDAYPHQTFVGRIAEIRLNPQTVQNVVTYSVIINVDNPDLKLRPGMTANVSVTIAQRGNALKVSNAALRYQPAGVTREQVTEMTGQPAGSNRYASGTQPRQTAGTSGNASSAEAPDTDGGMAAGRTGRGPATAEAILAPGQHWNAADKIHFPRQRPSAVRPAIVWVLEASGKPAPRRVITGVTDGVSTEIVSGDLRQGDRVVIADTSQAPAAAGGQRQPGGRGGGPGMFRF